MMPDAMRSDCPPTGFRSAGSKSTARARRILDAELLYIDHASSAVATDPDAILAPAGVSADVGAASASEAPWPPAPVRRSCLTTRKPTGSAR